MNIYIWERVSHLTSSWHHEGGCAIVAETLEEAREYIKGIPYDVF